MVCFTSTRWRCALISFRMCEQEPVLLKNQVLIIFSYIKFRSQFITSYWGKNDLTFWRLKKRKSTGLCRVWRRCFTSHPRSGTEEVSQNKHHLNDWEPKTRFFTQKISYLFIFSSKVMLGALHWIRINLSVFISNLWWLCSLGGSSVVDGSSGRGVIAWTELGGWHKWQRGEEVDNIILKCTDKSEESRLRGPCSHLMFPLQTPAPPPKS